MSFSPLFTDLYQLTMAEAYLASGRAGAQATFELFFRKCPFGGEYAIVAGYDLVQEILENFRFAKTEVEYLKTLPVFKNIEENFFEMLLDMDLSDIEILGLDEGEIVFPRVPILQVRGPIIKVQLLESALLNAVNFASLIATYARRIRMVAGSHDLVEFGMRRAQGPNGAMTATRASYLAGFDGTSNVLSGMHLQIPVIGTMAHSFVQSFSELGEKDSDWQDGFDTNPGELAAFLSYAKTFPDHCILLVDTYDTLNSGIPNAIRVFKKLQKMGHQPRGIRLDSGDLVYFSNEARRMLDESGCAEAKIYASNELDEGIVESLQDQGAKIDAYAIGTRLVTATADPALGGVYKLVEVDSMPRMKISQQTEKLVVPGAKQAYRLYGNDGHMLLDLLAHSSEAPPMSGEQILALHPSDPFKQVYVTPSRVKPLLKPLFKNGKWLDTKSLQEKRKNSLEGMKSLRSDIIRRANPAPYKVSLSENLKHLLDNLYKHERPASRLK